MLHLSWLLTPLKKFHPEIVSPFIADYCLLADTQGDTTYHYGYGSLKWALSFISETDQRNTGLIFFNILCEATAKKYGPAEFEYKILKFRSITRYRMALKAIDPIDITQLPIVTIGETKIIINTTGRKLSALIFRNIPDTGLIVSVGEKQFPSVKTRDTWRTAQWLALLSNENEGWTILTNPSGSTIINHTSITITANQIIETITPALI